MILKRFEYPCNPGPVSACLSEESLRQSRERKKCEQNLFVPIRNTPFTSYGPPTLLRSPALPVPRYRLTTKPSKSTPLNRPINTATAKTTARSPAARRADDATAPRRRKTSAKKEGCEGERVRRARAGEEDEGGRETFRRSATITNRRLTVSFRSPSGPEPVEGNAGKGEGPACSSRSERRSCSAVRETWIRSSAASRPGGGCATDSGAWTGAGEGGGREGGGTETARKFEAVRGREGVPAASDGPAAIEGTAERGTGVEPAFERIDEATWRGGGGGLALSDAGAGWYSLARRAYASSSDAESYDEPVEYASSGTCRRRTGSARVRGGP